MSDKFIRIHRTIVRIELIATIVECEGSLSVTLTNKQLIIISNATMQDIKPFVTPL